MSLVKKCMWIVCLLLNVNLFDVLSSTAIKEFPGSSAYDLIRKHGYPAELHHTVTDDGYILGIHRIPHGKNVGKQFTCRPPVLIVHGIFESASDWLYFNYSLPYALAEYGFDVWIANARGTASSMDHTYLDAKKDPRRYWNFSWHEIGYYDLPANIDYILKKTGKDKLNYIGFSQGVTTFCVLMSTKPSYNSKILLSISMAPAVIQKHLGSPLFRAVSRNTQLLMVLRDVFNINDFGSFSVARLFGHQLCGMLSPVRSICLDLLFLFGGFSDKAEYSNVDVSVIYSDTPENISMLQLIHFGQIWLTGHFTKFDYGQRENLKVYNSSFPPVYNLSEISSPAAVFYSKNDHFVSVEDANNFMKMLPNVVYEKLIPYELFNHVDFLYAEDVVSMVYNDVIDLVNKEQFSSC